MNKEDNIMKIRNFYIIILSLLISLSAQAQSHNEEVTVEGTYNPQIKRSERLIKMPELPKKEFHIPQYVVNTEDFFLQHEVELEPISPQQYNSNEFIEITNNFIKAGIGTQLSPDFLFRHYSELSRKMSLGIGILHNSTWLEIKDYPNSQYMNNAFNISMTNKFSGFQLHSYIDYHYDMYNLNSDLGSDYEKRNIHLLNVKLLSNNNQTSYKSIYNELSLDYNYSGIYDGTNENLLRFGAYLEHSDSWFRDRDNIQTLALDLNIDVDNIDQALVLISANPYLAFDGDYYNLHLGFRVDAKTNSTNMGGIYPDIKGSLYLFKKNIEFYAGLGGKTKINTLKEILSENPFIVGNLTNLGEFDYEKTWFAFQGGLKFNALNIINGHIGVRYRRIDNHIFYVSSTLENGTFDIILNNCYVFNFNADLHLKINDNIKIVGDFAYNKYDMNKAYMTADAPVIRAHAWYKPEIEFKLRGVYKYNQHWNFNVATYFEGKRYALTGDSYNDIKELKPICDIQLGCDYKLNEDLSFYTEIKNLIHNKYQMFYGYPSYGLQAFLGFKYRF